MYFVETSIGCYEAMPKPIPIDTWLELISYPQTDANEPCTIYINNFNIYVSDNEI